MNFDGTVTSLILAYTTDPVSPYVRPDGIRHCTRRHYDTLLNRLKKDHGHDRLSNLKARDMRRWHAEWNIDGKTAMAHSLMGMFRGLLGFGMVMLEEEQCERLSVVLSRMKFPQGKARVVRLTAEQVTAVRAQAHVMGKPSIALANAIQFECILRQKDVIGEWVPKKERVQSDVHRRDGMKWARGVLWEEIDDTLTLRHVTSKRDKLIIAPLLKAVMVVEELLLAYPGCITEHKDDAGAVTLVPHRELLPVSGPVIINEGNRRAWTADEFRRQWRIAATAAGIPKKVRNMDSRAGAITEALDTGLPMEKARKAATHSNSSMTVRYSRGEEEVFGEVMDARSKHRAGGG